MARIAVISDIHSNLVALEAVVLDVHAADAWWCIGDIVGYGPNPNEVIEVIQDLGAVCVRGNHDDGVLNLQALTWFNSAAGLALHWTAQQLSPSSTRFLQELPTHWTHERFRLVHGSPRDELTEYVTDGSIASASLRVIEEDVCFIGHTHIPSSFSQAPGDRIADTVQREHGQVIDLTGNTRHIINAGSVGQPRDGDCRAAYGILDTQAQTFTWQRVPYAIGETQERMRAAGLPGLLIERLSEGW